MCNFGLERAHDLENVQGLLYIGIQHTAAKLVLRSCRPRHSAYLRSQNR